MGADTTQDLPIDRAAERQAREDDVRAQMSQVLDGPDPRLPDRYDVVVDTSRISLDASPRRSSRASG